MTSNKKIAGIVGILIVTVLALLLTRNPTNIHNNAVMITNKAVNHGGTGITYRSGKNGSYVLTNDHVCKAIKDGGVVRTATNSYQVSAMLESQVSDLCLVFVASNLGETTKLAGSEPDIFTPATVSGHPALLPTIITNGHFSERAIIEVFTGMKECSPAEQQDPRTALICAFFGGIPVIKSYESILVSATIMPGSSGSGVYNSKNELSGVVFAGSGNFGYAWTVPYDQVAQFLTNEAPNGQFTNVDQTVTILQKQDDSKKIRDVLEKCSVATEDIIKNICNVIKRDMLWVK